MPGCASLTKGTYLAPSRARISVMEALIIIVGAVVLIGLIWAALRITIKRDRQTIKGDMEHPDDVEAYNKRWGKRH